MKFYRLSGNTAYFGGARHISPALPESPDRLRGWAIRQVGRGNAIDTEEVLLPLAKDMVPENDREHFLKITKEEIAALHEGNFARYRLRPAEFNDWQKRKK